ncbi:unnamed protein product [Eruca vesicaria subsp. sativa]|uniref:Uncharacterized protein n=1 Tax=Eruca vesicaria subsp. sativa TaxID=29727 RepID=A0ABC8IZF7_ERUVS|nr:unnamed protein product [Eruca vesicaria subsp. sativa]
MSESGVHKLMKESTKSASSSSGQGKLIGRRGVSSAISTVVRGTIPLTRGDRGKAIATNLVSKTIAYTL